MAKLHADALCIDRADKITNRSAHSRTTAIPSTVILTEYAANGYTSGSEYAANGYTDEYAANGYTDEYASNGYTNGSEYAANGYTDEYAANGYTDEYAANGYTDECAANGYTDGTPNRRCCISLTEPIGCSNEQRNLRATDHDPNLHATDHGVRATDHGANNPIGYPLALARCCTLRCTIECADGLA